MTPLRWVPFRVVCVLGMDQAAFGSPAPAADDLVAAAPRPGDRDPRAEARQALLEAVLAAGDHFVVVRDGKDVRTNQEIPRSVVAAELFDAVLALIDVQQRSAVADVLEVRHPRHPFDEKCFTKGALGEVGAWGFDPSDLAGALTRRRRTAQARPFLVDLLPSNRAEATAHGVRQGDAEPVEVDVELGDRTRIVGTVRLRLDPATPGPARVQYKKVQPVDRLAAWLDLMALAASDPSGEWRSVVIGRALDPRVVVEAVDLVPAGFGAADGIDPCTALEVAVDCYRRGMREPIPLFPVLSYEQHRSTARSSHWVSHGGGGDGEHAAVRLAFPDLDYQALMALPSRPGDPPGTGGRVDCFAEYLWGSFDRSATPFAPGRSAGPGGNP